MNWNIRLAYIQSITSAIGFGIVYVAFSIYVTEGLSQSFLILGSLFTISGVASTIFVFPSGYFADKYRRDILIRISVVFGLLSQIFLLMSTTVTDSPQVALTLLFASQGLSGLGFGLSGPSAQALIADSIEAGDRSKVFAQMHFANLLASAFGPFLAASLTFILGDTWALETLTTLIFVGSIANIISYLSILFVSDNKALKSPLEVSVESTEPSQEISYKKSDTFFFFGKSFSYDVTIPLLIVTSGIIIGFGAGATVAFFPVLFANTEIGYGLKPLFTYTVFGITNIVTGLMGLIAQRMIKNFGRIGSMFAVQGSAILCLLGIVINYFLFKEEFLIFSVSTILLVFFYISRNALMNASGPVSRSIVMDVIPPKSRAKWNSLETLAWGAFWSLSASLGGFIVDNFGFIYVFMFTSILYSVATLMLLTIKNRVPKESVLTRTYQLGKLTSRNRVVMPSSMIGDLRVADHAGQITKDAITYYEEAAEGGAGLIYLQPAYISCSGKGRNYQIGIHEDYCIPRLQEVIQEVHKKGALIGIRITHAGAATTVAITGEQPLAPSTVSIANCDIPKEMTIGEILEIQQDFVTASNRAARAGFDIIELSSYLDSYDKPDLFTQFISPEFNKRSDEYGGTFNKRIKFPLEVIKDIKTIISPKIILAYYLSVPTHGLTNEMITFIHSLQKVGVEMLSIDFKGETTPPETTQQIEKLRKELPSMPLILSGGFDVQSGENAIKKGQADMIGFERLFQKDKAFPQSLW